MQGVKPFPKSTCERFGVRLYSVICDQYFVEREAISAVKLLGVSLPHCKIKKIIVSNLL